MGKASRVKRLRKQYAAAQQAQHAAAQQVLVNRVQQSLPEEQIKIVKRRTGRKVSDVLMEFAEPWFDDAQNDEQRKIVVHMAVLAWNMAAFPEPERWEGMSPGFAEQLGKPARAILEQMIDRKVALYPEDKHSILDYQITGGGDNMRVEVIYTLSPEEIADLEHGNQ